MRKLTLFSTLLSLWIFGTRVSQGADGVSTSTAVHAGWLRQQAGLVKERVVASDLEGAATRVVNAVVRIETTLSTVEELMTEVARTIIDHDDDFLRLVEIVVRKYPALAASIALGAARGAPHIANAIGSSAGYGMASFWDRIRSASILFFQGIPRFTPINPATWSPELLISSKAKSAGVDIAWHHWSSNCYQQSPNDQSARPSAMSVSLDSREN
jgi:hypothetical protein